MTTDRQRIDKWLWHARVVRTRSAAAELAAGGYVRVNGARIAAASHAVKLGDVVTVALDRTVRVMKVAGFAERRGASEDARALFKNIGAKKEDSPAATAEEAPPAEPQRERGAGRPTKQERRALDRLRSREFN